jgi:anti-sigma factor RsiW
LDAAEEEELRRHLADGCEECAAALTEAKSILGMLPLAMEPVPPPATAHRCLMEKVRTVAQQAPAQLQWLALHWLIAGLAGAAIASMIVLLIVKR